MEVEEGKKVYEYNNNNRCAMLTSVRLHVFGSSVGDCAIQIHLQAFALNTPHYDMSSDDFGRWCHLCVKWFYFIIFLKNEHRKGKRLIDHRKIEKIAFKSTQIDLSASNYC